MIIKLAEAKFKLFFISVQIIDTFFYLNLLLCTKIFFVCNSGCSNAVEPMDSMDRMNFYWMHFYWIMICERKILQSKKKNDSYHSSVGIPFACRSWKKIPIPITDVICGNDFSRIPHSTSSVRYTDLMKHVPQKYSQRSSQL